MQMYIETRGCGVGKYFEHIVALSEKIMLYHIQIQMTCALKLTFNKTMQGD